LFESDTAYIFTEEELIDLCRWWQEKLYLEFWEVALRISRDKDMKKSGQAEVDCVLPKAMATIRILDPIDYPHSPFKQDMEKSLVHELLHLHFTPFDDFADDSLEHFMLERAVDQIAKTLVNLKRKRGQVIGGRNPDEPESDERQS
jgi:hypothetical protein